MNMKMKCNGCNRTIEPMELLSEARGQIERLYVKCEHCDKEYDVMFQCSNMRFLINRKKGVPFHMKQFNNLQKQIDTLNEKNREKFYR